MSRPQIDDREHGRRRGPALLVAVLAVGALVPAVLATISFSTLAGERDHGLGTTPDVVLLAGPLAFQELVWEECTFDEELAAPLPDADLSNVECATVLVPRDWNDPDPGSTWDLSISRAVNIVPEDPEYRTTIIAHPGGP
ncbi:hypothetical protein [Brachybacterium atlanticum]|uniref:hypothetical protein n=1 Tax=Brachybacterium atlanticum TaxID=2911888 RepID=UPI0021E017E9|nr:hypothetical protein [Brachybacterium atlanticum]